METDLNPSNTDKRSISAANTDKRSISVANTNRFIQDSQIASTTTVNIVTLSALETKKLKRTGFLPAFLCGGFLAGIVPIVNMAVRAELFVNQPGSPFHILMDANWQLMAQLNVLLIVCGACILYHTEYVDNGIQRIHTLPLKASGLFPGKLCILLFSCLVPLCLEAMALLFCGTYYFAPEEGMGFLLFEGMAFELVLLLPTAAAMLFFSSMCRNLWMCLGMGVILVFLSSMLHSGGLVLAMIPFAAPYRMLHQFTSGEALRLLAVSAGEILLFGMANVIYTKLWRCFQ